MCGIAGIVSARPLEQLGSRLELLSCSLQHRGPDDSGFLSYAGGSLSLRRQPGELPAGRLALVHRRLSIFDLSERGWQPMIDASGQYAIVYNGEIYNHPELRRELALQGITFRSGTDTEVLLQLLIQHGAAALGRVVGMFAFAFLDLHKRRLLLARDPFGIKPLFFARSEGELAFASEIRPLLDGGFAPRMVEPGPLFDYLRHAVTDHGTATLIQGIWQLPPAHCVEVDSDTGAIGAPVRYWTPSFEERSFASLDAAAEELRVLFTQSVELHLRADVPVAATLSGGIDSSAIVAAIRTMRSAESVSVFSYIADEPALNEEAYVDSVAAATDLRPCKIRLTPAELAADLDRLILLQQQPFTTTSIWAQNRVFRQVRDSGFKVVLDGQGADELFAGYPVFRAARMTALIQRREWGALRQLVGGSPGAARELMRSCEPLLPEKLRRSLRHLVGRPDLPAWLNAGWFGRQVTTYARPTANLTRASPLTGELYDAMAVSSLPMLLRYADRNAMAVSLENRVPFLSVPLAEFALSLPDALRIGPDGTTKLLFRRAMRGLVPDIVLDRRDKIGFATPEGRWFRDADALRAALQAQARLPLPTCFAPVVTHWLRDVSTGTRPYSAEVWRTWNVLRWAELMQLEFPA